MPARTRLADSLDRAPCGACKATTPITPATRTTSALGTETTIDMIPHLLSNIINYNDGDFEDDVQTWSMTMAVATSFARSDGTRKRSGPALIGVGPQEHRSTENIRMRLSCVGSAWKTDSY